MWVSKQGFLETGLGMLMDSHKGSCGTPEPAVLLVQCCCCTTATSISQMQCWARVQCLHCLQGCWIRPEQWKMQGSISTATRGLSKNEDKQTEKEEKCALPLCYLKYSNPTVTGTAFFCETKTFRLKVCLLAFILMYCLRQKSQWKHNLAPSICKCMLDKGHAIGSFEAYIRAMSELWFSLSEKLWWLRASRKTFDRESCHSIWKNNHLL